MDENCYREYLKCNVLTSSEVTELLKVSRQRLSAIVKANDILPIKQTSQGMLFLRSDIQKYIQNKKAVSFPPNIFERKPIFDFSGTTRNSLNFFNENIEKLAKIDSIYIYFDKIDAAINGFYLKRDDVIGQLNYITTPYFVIRDVNGQELWLGGCNCGYGGEGPHGSIHILEYLCNNNLIELGQIDLEELILNQVIDIFTNSKGNADIQTRDSIVGTADYGCEACIYSYCNHLVLLQNSDISWSIRDKYALPVLERYRAFIPHPTDILLFPNSEMAKDAGYISLSHRGLITYQIIIVDETGRQLWLNPLIDEDMPLYQQKNIQDILNACGYNIDIQINKQSTLFNWLKNVPRICRIKPHQPLHIQIPNFNV